MIFGRNNQGTEKNRPASRKRRRTWRRGGMFLEGLEDRLLLACDLPLAEAEQKLDFNQDGFVSSIDSLTLLNFLGNFTAEMSHITSAEYSQEQADEVVEFLNAREENTLGDFLTRSDLLINAGCVPDVVVPDPITVTISDDASFQYDPSTGNLSLSSTNALRQISTYGADGLLVPAGANGFDTDDSIDESGLTRSDAAGFTTIDLGNILPTDQTLAQLNAFVAGGVVLYPLDNGPVTGSFDQLLEVSTRIVDSSGAEITQVDQFGEFHVEVELTALADHLNAADFMSAIVDVTFDSDAVSVTGGLQHPDATTQSLLVGSVTTGLIDEAGGPVAGQSGEMSTLLFSVPMQANAQGNTLTSPLTTGFETFPSSSDNAIVLTTGNSVPDTAVRFSSAQLTINPSDSSATVLSLGSLGSLVYSDDGNLAVDGTSNIQQLLVSSDNGLFQTAAALNLDGASDELSPVRLVKTSDAGFSDLDFGPVLPSNLTATTLTDDLQITAIPTSGAVYSSRIQMQIAVQAVDADLQPISTVTVGDEFSLLVSLIGSQDIPLDAIESALVDINFDNTVLSAKSLSHADTTLVSQLTGSLNGGLIDDAGGQPSVDPSGLLFVVEMEAIGAGTVSIDSSAAGSEQAIKLNQDVSLPAELLFFGQTNLTVQESVVTDMPVEVVVDASTSLFYDSSTGELRLVSSEPISTLRVNSNSGIFTGTASGLDGAFDTVTTTQLSKFSENGFETANFSTVVTPGLTAATLLDDLTVELFLLGQEVPAENKLVEYRVTTTDTFGNPISTVSVGQEYLVSVSVQDLRTAPSSIGVASGFVDVTFNSSLTNSSGDITFGADFDSETSGSLDDGVLNEVGGVHTGDPLGAAATHLFSVPMLAISSGSVTFASELADMLPEHATMVIGDSQSIAPPFVVHEDATLQIVDPVSAILIDIGRGGELVYDPNDGTLSVNNATPLTTLNIDSSSAIFRGSSSNELTGIFDVDTDTKIFKLDPDGFQDTLFGRIALTHLTETELANSLTITGSVLGGGGLEIDMLPLVEFPLSGVTVNYNPNSGSFAVSSGIALTSIEVTSANEIFGAGEVLTFSQDGGFTGHDFGTVADVNLTEEILVGDLAIVSVPLTTQSEPFSVMVQDQNGNPLTLLYDAGQISFNSTTAYESIEIASTWLTGGQSSLLFANSDPFTNHDFGLAALTGLEQADIANAVVTTVAADLAEVTLDIVDADGIAIDVVEPGDEFTLNIYVEDLRSGAAGEASGPFFAFFDVLFDPQLATPGAVSISPLFPDDNQNSIADGRLSVGGQTSLAVLGDTPQLLASVTMTAASPGDANFTIDNAMVSLIEGDQATVPTDQISVGAASIEIEAGVPGPLSLQAVDDVNLLSGSPLHVPLNGSSVTDQALTFTVTSDNPSVSASVLEGNRSLSIDVQDFGEMVFELFDNRAPRVTDQIATLAGSGFYDGVIFHRVIDQFVIQGGDPLGNGTGGSSLPDFDDQFHVDLQHNRTGILSMAKSLDDTNNSQFFITEGPQRHLDFNHSIFGQLVKGEDVREAISNVPILGAGTPVTDVVISEATVFTDTENGVLMLSAAEGFSGDANITVTVTDEDNNTHSRTFAVSVTPDQVNGQPFLADIGPVNTLQDTQVEFSLSAMDAEAEAVEFYLANPSSNAEVTVNGQTGVVTVVPNAGFSGELSFRVAVRAANNPMAEDSQLVTVQVEEVVAPAEEVVIPVSTATSVVYDPATGELSVDTTEGVSSIEIKSADGIFTGDPGQFLDGLFDVHTPEKIFKLVPDGFDSLSFGNVAQTGLTAEFIRDDLTITGSPLAGGILSSEPVGRFTLEVTDVDGNAIDTVAVGDTFLLQGSISDVRAAGIGFSAIFADVTFDPQLTSVTGTIDHGLHYVNEIEGNTFTAGLIDEVGGSADGFVGAGPTVVFTATMSADAAGQLTFGSDAPESHDAVLAESGLTLDYFLVDFESIAIDVIDS